MTIGRPHLPPLTTVPVIFATPPTSTQYTSRGTYDDHSQTQQHLPSPSLDRLTSGTAQPYPSINVLPPTPEVLFAVPTALAVTHPSTPVSDDPMSASTSMNISPVSSFSRLCPPSPSKKPRLTMGPRADCEKCRLGVKGHWMHLD